jgi:hypothetical protein
MTVTLGIDLASRPDNTALALIDWEGPRATVTTIAGGPGTEEVLHDKWLVSTMRGMTYDGGPPSKVAIDAPFGWPKPFVEALASYHAGEGWPELIDNPRAKFERRRTDNFVREHTGKLPLSVSTDRIAYAAMRCATLLSDLERFVGPEGVARDGSGLVAEVYPDPALRLWLPEVWADGIKGFV